MAGIARGDAVIDRALQVIANAVTLEQLSQAQAVVLPIRFRMSLKQTAQVTGLSLGWVSKLRNRFIQGKPMGGASVPARGSRRHQNFTFRRDGEPCSNRFCNKPLNVEFWCPDRSTQYGKKPWVAHVGFMRKLLLAQISFRQTLDRQI